MLFELPSWQWFCKCVCCHIFGRTVNGFDEVLCYNISYVMIVSVDVLHSGMEVVFYGKFQGGLIVTEKWDR